MGHNLTLFIHFDIPFLFPPQMNKLFMKNYSLSKICTTVRKQAARLSGGLLVCGDEMNTPAPRFSNASH